MTHLIPAGSLKADRAIRFGRELGRAMKARGVGRRPVAEAVGCGQSAVQQWRKGYILPRIAMAQKLADALDWPRLVSLSTELRKKRCVVDDVEFVDDSGSDNRIYCSNSCRRVEAKRRIGSPIDKRAAIAERRLKVHLDAVLAFCMACEPQGQCFAPECELRPVSPLPLVEERASVERVVARGNGWIEAENRRLAASTAQSRIWAAMDPEARKARIEKTAEASKRARGLVPA